MSSRCEKVGKHVLPIFRALIAKELISTHKLTQVDAARRLGTTQAAISQYISSKRAFKGKRSFKDTEEFGNFLPILEAKAIVVAKRMTDKEISSAEVVMEFCTICPSFCRGQPRESRENQPDYTI